MENTFRSDDILLCSFLLTQNIQFIEIVEDYPRHFVFIFSNPEKCEQLKREYINGATAPAKQLFIQREVLISEIKNKNQKEK